MTIRSLTLHEITKSYYLTLVTTSTGRTVLIRRWGKKGAFGELKAETYERPIQGEKAWDKLEREKTGKGYRQEGPMRVEEVKSAAELKSKMGLPVFAKMGKEAVSWLDPDLDTSGMRDAEPPRIGEDGRLTGEDKPRKVDLSAELAAQKAADAKAAEETLRKNPNFGRFG
jgi:predicted DNA-binding WGR domain protein